MSSPHDGIHTDPHHYGDLADAAAHGHQEHTPAPLPFSDADVAGFRKDDVHAGKMIVGLMAGIFSVGVFLYILVALSTWTIVTM
jgi:hypothetical protein